MRMPPSRPAGRMVAYRHVSSSSKGSGWLDHGRLPPRAEVVKVYACSQSVVYETLGVIDREAVDGLPPQFVVGAVDSLVAVRGRRRVGIASRLMGVKHLR